MNLILKPLVCDEPQQKKTDILARLGKVRLVLQADLANSMY